MIVLNPSVEEVLTLDIREADLLEARRLGYESRTEALLDAVERSHVYWGLRDDTQKLYAVGGFVVGNVATGLALPWAWTGKELAGSLKLRKEFVAAYRWALSRIQRTFPAMRVYVDNEHSQALKLLERSGFRRAGITSIEGSPFQLMARG